MQNVPVCTGTTRTCVTTCARGAGTHGDVLNLHTEVFLDGHTEGRGSSSVLLTKICHVWSSRASEVHHKKPIGSYPFSVWEQVERATRCRFLQTFAVPDEAVEGHCGGNQHAQHTPTHTHTHQHILTHRPTHHHLPSLPTLPLPHPHAHANAHVHVHVHVPVPVPVPVYVYVYVYMYVYVYVYVVWMCKCLRTCICLWPSTMVHVTLANISYRYEHIKTCHHESSRTPQHSKWKCGGTNGARPHSHERTKNSNRSKKINFRDDENRIRIF